MILDKEMIFIYITWALSKKCTTSCSCIYNVSEPFIECLLLPLLVNMFTAVVLRETLDGFTDDFCMSEITDPFASNSFHPAMIKPFISCLSFIQGRRLTGIGARTAPVQSTTSVFHF